MKSKYLIVLAGPTAVGKTSISIQLANMLDCPILSADSRQIYKEMNIGTAKPDKIELAAAKHHFIDLVSIHDNYNAGQYERDAIAILDDIYKTKDVAIISGGTGLYINAVLNGLDEFPSTTPEDEAIYETKSLEELQTELKEKDPSYYEEVDIHNKRRLTRALAVINTSGELFSALRKANFKERIFQPIYIFLERDRSELYDRINQRVDMMLENGLLEEAKNLYTYRSLRSLKTVGYQELFDFFEGNITEEKAIELIKRNSRRYAKRQLTWHRNKPEWNRFHPNDIDEIKDFIQESLGLE